MFTVYALYSDKYDKIYIGYTSDLHSRLISHNEISINTFISKYRPWRVIYTEEHIAKKDAMLREKQLKTGAGRKFIREMIKDEKLN
jgi:putative endonuclease